MLSNCTYSPADPLEKYYGNPMLQGCVSGFIIFAELVGNGLISAIIMYEKYGMDSMKRTAGNQLISQALCSVIVYNLVLMIWALRFFVGPLGQLIAKIVVSSFDLMMFMVGWLFPTLMVLKLAFVSNWTWITHLPDDFLATWAGRLLFLWSLMNVASRWIIGDFEISAGFQFYAGVGFQCNEFEAIMEEAYLWRIHVNFTVGLAIFIICFIAVRKSKMRTNQVLDSGFNNVAKNPNLVSTLAVVIIMITFVLIVLFPVFLPNLTDAGGKSSPLRFVWNRVAAHVTCSVLLPCLFFASNADARKAIKEMM